MDYNGKNVPDIYGYFGMSIKDSNEPNFKEVLREKFRNLAKQFHPDKNKSPSAKEYYLLLTSSYEILSDDVTRLEYNQVYGNKCGQNHNTLKQQYRDFNETYVPPAEKKIDFKELNVDYDESTTYSERLANMEKRRKEQDDFKIPRVFQQMDNKKFNQMFMKYHHEDPDEIGEPGAYNDDGDGDYHGIEFSNVEKITYHNNLPETKVNFNYAELENVNPDDLDENHDYDSHNHIEENYHQIIKQKLLERKRQTEELSSKKR